MTKGGTEGEGKSVGSLTATVSRECSDEGN